MEIPIIIGLCPELQEIFSLTMRPSTLPFRQSNAAEIEDVELAREKEQVCVFNIYTIRKVVYIECCSRELRIDHSVLRSYLL
jgi:hypothetical protein